jgi:dynein heavy chain
VTFTNVWFFETLLQPGFKFYEGYPLPDFRTIEEYQDHIINMPLQDIPEVFGLHSNADISYQVFIIFANLIFVINLSR